MKNLLLAVFFCTCTISILAQEETVTNLEFSETIVISGNLNSGMKIPLEWAQSSQIACFPGTRFNEFKGHHVYYRVQLPARSDMTISVTPINKKHRINLYALRLGEDNMSTPPDIISAISCEASYPIYVGRPNLNKTNKAQTVEFMSTTKSYTILIGIAGAKDVLDGSFDLNIETKSR